MKIGFIPTEGEIITLNALKKSCWLRNWALIRPGWRNITV